MAELTRANQVRIATFNTENLGSDDSGAPLVERLAVLRPQLLRLRADILCLQEVNGHLDKESGERRLEALDRLLEGTPYQDFQLVSTTGASGTSVRDRHNLVILSRFPISAHKQIIHDLIAPPAYRRVMADPMPKAAEDVTWDRPFLACSVALTGGRTLHVVNLHLRAPRAAFIPGQKETSTVWRTVPGWAEGFFLAVIKRAGQALEARLFIDRLFDDDPDALILVAGDFNSEIHDIPVRMIRGDEEDTGNGALVRRVLIPLEQSLPDSRRHSVIHSGRRLMLDHLLASQTLMSWYRTAEIHNEALGDEIATPAVVSGSPESYHAPMVAEFQFPGEAS